MITIPGYKIIEKLYESSSSLIYRGQCDSDEFPVILKMLKQEYPTLEAIARFRSEYDITCNLNLEGVIKAYALEKYQHRLVMVLEDFGGISLDRLINDKKFTLEEFLTGTSNNSIFSERELR